jgi:hypothetical protein
VKTAFQVAVSEDGQTKYFSRTEFLRVTFSVAIA